MPDACDAEGKQFAEELGGILDAEVRYRRRLNQTPWKYLTIDQKLERMREVIKQFERQPGYGAEAGAEKQVEGWF